MKDIDAEHESFKAKLQKTRERNATRVQKQEQRAAGREQFKKQLADKAKGAVAKLRGKEQQQKQAPAKAPPKAPEPER